MRCPKCGNRQLYKQGRTCRTCHYAWQMNHKAYPYLSDWRVNRSCLRVGAKGARWFTANQVVADLARRRKFRLGIMWFEHDRRLRLARQAVADYATATGAFPGMIVNPMFEAVAPPRWPEPDLFDYGAERILVVDDRVVVDLLVRTGVHLSARAIILSVDGYPSAVVARARTLVAERPEITIGVLHGSGAGGAGVVRRTRALLAVPEDSIVVDLGLAPDAAKRLKTLRWARRITNIPVDCLPYAFLTAGLTAALMAGPVPEDALVADDGDDHPPLAWLGSDNDDDFG
jgi:hypothetical protein